MFETAHEGVLVKESGTCKGVDTKDFRKDMELSKFRAETDVFNVVIARAVIHS